MVGFRISMGAKFKPVSDHYYPLLTELREPFTRLPDLNLPRHSFVQRIIWFRTDLGFLSSPNRNHNLKICPFLLVARS